MITIVTRLGGSISFVDYAHIYRKYTFFGTPVCGDLELRSFDASLIISLSSGYVKASGRRVRAGKNEEYEEEGRMLEEER